MAVDAVELVKLRSTFYRDSYRKLVILLFLSWVIIAILALALFVQVGNKPKPTYFATTESGRIIKLVPLNEPNLSDRALIQWATNAVLAVYTYNFNNYRQVFQDSRQYFTDDGWQQFITALSQSRNLQAVQDKKLVLSAVVSSAPIVNREYVAGNGKYTWEIQLPVMVTYQSLSEEFHENLVIVLRVQRVSTLDSSDGVGIISFVARSG